MSRNPGLFLFEHDVLKDKFLLQGRKVWRLQDHLFLFPKRGGEPVFRAKGGLETFKVCLSGEILCPAKFPICDDPQIVQLVDTPDGLGFKAIAPGTTLCSAQSLNKLRRVFRILIK